MDHPTIDVHAHVVPPASLARWQAGPRDGIELLEAPQAPPRLRIDGRVTTGPILPGLVDIDDRLARMDAQGVDIQLLSPFIDTTAYALPAEQAAEHARVFNDHLAELIAATPDRFRGLATVPLQDPPAAVAELTRAMDEHGMVGCEIATTVDGVELADPRFEPFWEAAADRAALLLLHPHAALAGRDLTEHFLWNLVGNPAESTVALGHLLLSGVLERHPSLRLCAVHGGGFLPYQLGRFDRGYAALPDRVAKQLTQPPSVWARHLSYDTVTHAPAALRWLLDTMGASQVVLGSDHPFIMGDPDPVATVDAIPGLTAEERTAILGGNAARLLESAGS